MIVPKATRLDTPAQVFLGSTREPWARQVLRLLLEFRPGPMSMSEVGY